MDSGTRHTAMRKEGGRFVSSEAVKLLAMRFNKVDERTAGDHDGMQGCHRDGRI